MYKKLKIKSKASIRLPNPLNLVVLNEFVICMSGNCKYDNIMIIFAFYKENG